MTINSLNLDQSAVMIGLGTQTFNVPADGRYVVEYKATIPTAPLQVTNPSPASVDITTRADSGKDLNSTYFTFYNAADNLGWYVWYNVDDTGDNPMIPGLIDIQVAISEDDTADDVAAATRTAISSDITLVGVSVSGATDHVILSNVLYGANTAAADGEAPTDFTFDNTAGSFGVPAGSGLNVVISQNDDVVLRNGNPTPTEPIMGSSVLIEAEAEDVITVVLSSISSADLAANAVKTIINLYLKEYI